jgi:hypothetical protein
MKYEIKKKISLITTLSSSETTMFNQGGKHSIILNLHNEELELGGFDELELSVQLERDEQGRFDFINSEAARHRKQLDEINKQESKPTS